MRVAVATAAAGLSGRAGESEGEGGCCTSVDACSATSLMTISASTLNERDECASWCCARCCCLPAAALSSCRLAAAARIRCSSSCSAQSLSSRFLQHRVAFECVATSAAIAAPHPHALLLGVCAQLASALQITARSCKQHCRRPDGMRRRALKRKLQWLRQQLLPKLSSTMKLDASSRCIAMSSC